MTKDNIHIGNQKKRLIKKLEMKFYIFALDVHDTEQPE